MTICNITMKVSWHIHNEWIHWMRSEYIPYVMKSGSYEKYQWCRLTEVDETDGPTYCVQYFLPEKIPSDQLPAEDVAIQLGKVVARWGSDCLAFRTIMNVVH
ncbi:MAG TPA: DUF4286 family protein [Flavitalea sp.]|nr:DUF4286 family protein [Flavitalea sp.]